MSAERPLPKTPKATRPNRPRRRRGTVAQKSWHPAAALDVAHHWHPFTQMRDWARQEPIVLRSGQGTVLYDVHDHPYLDANSSIWTNLHGHNHPRINAAITDQLQQISHTSALGLANVPGAQLAGRLVKAANPSGIRRSRHLKNPLLTKVFFSDDGSTAIEVALKLAYEYARRTGQNSQPRFVSLEGSYHGDTIGAVSLGHIDLFHHAYRGLLFRSDKAMAPYCYRCPYNRARPERADARTYRQCRWECVDQVEAMFSGQAKRGKAYSAMVVEPLLQGAAGMIPQPAGWLRRVTEIVRGHGAQLIADEIMTGFGRVSGTAEPLRLFACHRENVQPDYLALAKGLTGGYLPMAATLTTQAVFDVFLGEYDDFKTFFHGHSYTANQLGARAALASLDILETRASLRQRERLERAFDRLLPSLWTLPAVGDVRRVGSVVGIELVKRWQDRTPFALKEQAGIRVCQAMARRGVLTRPIGNILVLMPPYCTTVTQLRSMVGVLHEAIAETL